MMPAEERRDRRAAAPCPHEGALVGSGAAGCRQSRAAAMWPVCVWAAGRVGEKEGEEAAEATAPLISSFLNTFKAPGSDRRAQRPRPRAGTDGAHTSGRQVRHPRAAGTAARVPLERTAPQQRQASAHVLAAGSAGAPAGMLAGRRDVGMWVAPGADAGSRSSSQGPLCAFSLAGASPKCFLGDAGLPACRSRL